MAFRVPVNNQELNDFIDAHQTEWRKELGDQLICVVALPQMDDETKKLFKDPSVDTSKIDLSKFDWAINLIVKDPEHPRVKEIAAEAKAENVLFVVGGPDQFTMEYCNLRTAQEAESCPDDCVCKFKSPDVNISLPWGTFLNFPGGNSTSFACVINPPGTNDNYALTCGHTIPTGVPCQVVGTTVGVAQQVHVGTVTDCSLVTLNAPGVLFTTPGPLSPAGYVISQTAQPALPGQTVSFKGAASNVVIQATVNQLNFTSTDITGLVVTNQILLLSTQVLPGDSGASVWADYPNASPPSSFLIGLVRSRGILGGTVHYTLVTPILQCFSELGLVANSIRI
eukprot:TRINITY_DN3711_c0_g2_i2.p1 TRINITY_DN3711_c0_g2~~TRINITY_DN3711_c0_g2_i2.p1  ORF type:complete len:339 (-),score=19.14 TRINITY_DN3711_c0_g2_i2:150-1166(-)